LSELWEAIGLLRCRNDKIELYKRSQLFIGTHNESLSVVAMCVCNPDRSPLMIHG